MHDQSFLSTAMRTSLGATLLLLALVGVASAYDTKAKQAIMLEAGSGTILYAKDIDKQIPPASLAKLMGMEAVFHALKQGEIKLTDMYTVSEHAWRTGGAPSGTSTMFAAIKSQIAVQDLIRGVIVQAANDGCIILAEGIDGSEEKFAERMNARAKEIGLTGSVFKNCTGLPAPGQVVTMRDLIKLARYVWQTYPEFYTIYSEPEFTWNKITQRNRNPLLAMKIGADGLSTGFTEESGYGLVASVVRGKTRLFAAMSGLETEKDRAEEARAFFSWALDGFQTSEIFQAGATVGTARVYGGEKPRVDLKAASTVTLLMPTTEGVKVNAEIVYEGPRPAPIEEGTPMATLVVKVGDDLVQETPLYAAESVAVGPVHRRAYDALEELAIGWLR